jgi:hypothetical protein
MGCRPGGRSARLARRRTTGSWSARRRPRSARVRSAPESRAPDRWRPARRPRAPWPHRSPGRLRTRSRNARPTRISLERVELAIGLVEAACVLDADGREERRLGRERVELRLSGPRARAGGPRALLRSLRAADRVPLCAPRTAGRAGLRSSSAASSSSASLCR